MSVRLPSTALAAVVALAACGGSAPSADPTPVRQDAPSVSASAAVSPGTALSGQEVVEQVCSPCHSMEPPPLAAPPLTHLSNHLRQTFATVDEAVAHVLAYAPAPDAERSILPPMAVERFGLMPPQPLPAPLLDAAARYIWSLADSTDANMGGMGMGRGGMGQGGMGMGGMGMGRGMAQPADSVVADSTALPPPMRMRRRGGGGGSI